MAESNKMKDMPHQLVVYLRDGPNGDPDDFIYGIAGGL